MAEQHRYSKQPQQQGGAGVRAEPVFIRDPSAFESLSSVLTGVSSYVTNNLPASLSGTKGLTTPSSPGFPPNSTNAYYYPPIQGSSNSLLGGNQDNLCVLTKGDVVLFSAFDWIDSGNLPKNKSSRRFCLLLGYADGFQIWDLTHPDNIHEIASVRNIENQIASEVTFLKVLPPPQVPHGKVDKFEYARPLVAIMSGGSTEDGAFTSRKILFYSLATHEVVAKLDFTDQDYEISALDVNERAIVVSLIAPGDSTKLHLVNPLTLVPIGKRLLSDVAYPGVFDLGTRLLAYVTTSETDTDSKNGEHDAEGGGYQDLAKGVAKEVIGGVKILGGFAHQTISSYWSSNSGGSTAPTSPPMQPSLNKPPHQHSRRASASVDYPDRGSNPTRRRDDNSSHKREAVGTIMIRDISTLSVIAHFKPHDHPITGCKFSPSGRLLLTTSRQGNVFHVHELRPSIGSGSRHMYKLARGITQASVEDIVFNEDETWVAVTTSRGTTHMYAINPFGGTPDVGAHMYTGTVNWTAAAIEFPTSLSALCRIKQRHHVPDIILPDDALEDMEPQTTITGERRQNTLRRQSSQDSMSSAGTGSSEQNQAYINKLLQQYSTFGGRQRAMITAHFLPSTTVFASGSSNMGLYHDEDEDTGELSDTGNHFGDERHLSQFTNPNTLLINRSKAPPVSTAAKLQSKASNFWQALNPPAVIAQSLASLPGLVKESSLRGRTTSGMGMNNGPNPHPSAHGAGTEGTINGTRGQGVGGHRNSGIYDSTLSSAQQPASQVSLAEPERGPSFTDMYVFNPLGVLTLHRCWISSTRSKRTINGRQMETSEMVLAPEDVVEWTLNRSSEWAAVKRSLAPNAGRKGTQQATIKKASPWNSQGEIQPYNNGINSGWKGQYPILNQSSANGNHSSTIVYTQPQPLLWKSAQFTFQTYVGPVDEIQREFEQGKLPMVQTQTLNRGVLISATRKDERLVDTSDTDNQVAWIAGMPVSMNNNGSRSHGRDVSYDGESEILSEDLSSAMADRLPNNRNYASPSSVGRFSTSLRAEPLSFEDALRIDSGSGSANSRTGFGPGSHPQHTFLSTPPAENAVKGRPFGTSPASPSAIPTMTGYGNTPITSPLASSFGAAMGSNGYRAGSPGSNHYSTNRHSQQMQGRGLISRGASPAPVVGSPDLIALGKSIRMAPPNPPMSQTTVISPDGDNEMGMPLSMSVIRDPTRTTSQLSDSFKRLSTHASEHFNSRPGSSFGGEQYQDDFDYHPPQPMAMPGYNPTTEAGAAIVQGHYDEGPAMGGDDFEFDGPVGSEDIYAEARNQ